MTRRRFVKVLGGGAGLAATSAAAARDELNGGGFFMTRGVVLVPEDLTLEDWPERARAAGLTTIALHHSSSPQHVVRFVRSRKGEQFLAKCRALGLQVEYEVHAMRELLPRDFFEKDATLFRVNSEGERTADWNLCVHSKEALEIVGQNAVLLAERLRPTTSRYFFWGDDGKPWCRCGHCRGLSDSDQALVLENRLLEVLRERDPRARVAHLAYRETLWPPEQIKPKAGVFLEYAPIERGYDVPLAEQKGAESGRHLEALDANLAVFGRQDAQALEYWLDVSMFSQWKRPAVKLPFRQDVFLADLETYGSRGVRHITSFAVYIDAEYVQRYGDPPLDEYGKGLLTWQSR